jgi:hypothetical protein
MHAIIMEMLKANPNERISSADVVSKINNFNPRDKKKPYAAFLIDRSSNNQAQGGENFKVALMNCLRYRLRIALNLKSNTETNPNSNLEQAVIAFSLLVSLKSPVFLSIFFLS